MGNIYIYNTSVKVNPGIHWATARDIPSSCLKKSHPSSEHVMNDCKPQNDFKRQTYAVEVEVILQSISNIVATRNYTTVFVKVYKRSVIRKTNNDTKTNSRKFKS